MTGYDEVCSILWAEKGWPADCAPAPDATNRELSERTPREVAYTLDYWVGNVVQTTEPPYGIVGYDQFYRWVCHRTFARGREFWEYGTAIALGQIVEKPVDKIAEARSVSEWFRNQSLDRKRSGYVLFEDTPASQAEKARRLAKAADVPLEWRAAGKADIWSLAVIEGMIPTTVDNLSAAYAVSSPALADVRGLDAQQWLDNLRADDKGQPRPWGAK